MMEHNEEARVRYENPLETTLLTVQADKSDVVYKCVMCGRRTSLSTLGYLGGREKASEPQLQSLEENETSVVKRLGAV